MIAFARIGLAALVAAAASPALMAQDIDIRPLVSGGQITTNGYSDPTSEFFPGKRVFLWEFQEDPSDPYFASDPGINSPAGSGLVPGSLLTFNVLDGSRFGLPANLSYWDGNDAASFGPVPDGETLALELGKNSATVGSTLGDQAGYAIQTVTGLGAVHKHLGSFLNGSGDDDPTEGVYLLTMELASSDPGTQKSLPFVVLYGNFTNGISEEQVDAAFTYAETLLVPEPSGVVLACLAGAGLAGMVGRVSRRRRRH
jgi:hypothetical protein